MAGYPISELKKAPESKGRDLIPIQQDGVTRQVELGILSNASKITASTSSGVITKEGSYVLQNNSAVINFTLNNAVGRTFSNNDYVDSASAAAGWIVKVINLSTRSHTVIAGSNSWSIAAGDVHEYYWTGSAWTFHNVVTESRLNNALATYTKFLNRNTESITDANDLPEGFYVANNITNGLAGWTSYFTTKVDNNNNYRLQYAISNNGYMKFRRCNGGAWLDWEKLTTDSDIKSVEYEVKPDTDITTGSVNGARFFQKEVLLNSLVSGLNVTRIKGVYIDYIYSSADYIPLPFVVGDKLYINFYCARTNQTVRAVTQVIIKIIYI